MDITDTDISNASTTDDIRPEDDEENLQDNEKQEQTKNTMSDLPSSSYARKRTRSKEDKISVILAKRLKDTNDIMLSIQEQNKLLATNTKTLWEEDHVDMFYKSIAMTVKKMSPQAIKQAKLNTLTGVFDADDKYSTPQTAQTLPYQVPSNYNNMYQCQLSSPANPYKPNLTYGNSTSSRGFLPFRFNYDDTSNI